MIVAPDGEVLTPFLVYDAPVKVTVPKSAKGTRDPFSSKSWIRSQRW